MVGGLFAPLCRAMLQNIPVYFQGLRLACGSSTQHVCNMEQPVSRTKCRVAAAQSEGAKLDPVAKHFVQQTGSKRAAIGAIERFKKTAGPLDRGGAEIDLAAGRFIQLACSKRAAIRAIRSPSRSSKADGRGREGCAFCGQTRSCSA